MPSYQGLSSPPKVPRGICIVLDLDKASHGRHVWMEDRRRCSSHCYRWHRGWFIGRIFGRNLGISWTFLFLLGWLIGWTISRVGWICLVRDFWWLIGWTFSGVGWIGLFRDFKQIPILNKAGRSSAGRGYIINDENGEVTAGVVSAWLGSGFGLITTQCILKQQLLCENSWLAN